MALRLIEMTVSEDVGKHVRASLEDYDLPAVWEDHLADGNTLVRVLLDSKDVEPILDLFQKNYGSLEEFRAIVLKVEAALPRPEKDEPENGTDSDTKTSDEKNAKHDRISREELYTTVAQGARLSKVFIAMVILSSIVATIGVLRDNLAVIIGAMVIAPLLGPNVALSLATTLGDVELGRSSAKVNFVGIVAAILLATALGELLQVDPQARQLASRTVVNPDDIVLALAAGAAGALAFTSGLPAALVGVMVAVALLPPLVSIGLLLGSGNWQPAWGATLLFFTNFICINLSGVATFWLQGVRPRDWREATKAKSATFTAFLIWGALLAALAVIIIYSRQ
jgi:uncharacterized hydrophobic protein (TIGR00341 family)